MCFLCTSSGQVRNSESAWRLPFPRRQRSVLHSFSPRNTEGLTHFQRISMWPQGQSHNHGVLMCPALCHCQKLMRLTQCPCPCQVYGHLKGLQPLACSNALLLTNLACSPETSEGHGKVQCCPVANASTKGPGHGRWSAWGKHVTVFTHTSAIQTLINLPHYVYFN